MRWREQPSFPLCLALGRSAGYCFLSAAVLWRRLCSLCLGSYHWLSCSDEAGQITLSAQPAQSVKNEECEHQSTVFSTVSCSAEVNVNVHMALYNLYYLKQVSLQLSNSWGLANPLFSNSLYWNLAVNYLCQVISFMAHCQNCVLCFRNMSVWLTSQFNTDFLNFYDRLYKVPTLAWFSISLCWGEHSTFSSVGKWGVCGETKQCLNIDSNEKKKKEWCGLPNHRKWYT